MKQKIYTASEARDNLYSIIKSAATGLSQPTIKLRGSDPVVIVNQEEYEGWMETLEILSIPGALESIREGEKDMKAGKGVSLDQLK